MGELRLEVREFTDLTRWRWVLTGADGQFAADHEVRLDATCWQYKALADLLAYLRWHAAPDRQAEDEVRIVAEIGHWIGTQVLGRVATALVKARPMTVRVIVPPQARALLFWPLELAHVDGKPVAVQDVTLVMQPEPEGGDSVVPVGDRLRMLGLFSLPEGGQPLNLRRERHSLVQLIRGIAAVGKAADVRVLQYGVTRDRLREMLEEGEGWDIIHISGHGLPGTLMLETAAGQPDRVTSAELVDMLDLARERVKLVTVAACWSGALTAAEQRRLLGLPVPELGHGEGSANYLAEALATRLAERLGCAVLAMRYPVEDDFAIALTNKMYDLLASKGQSLPRAVGIALKQVMAQPAASALSAGTPSVFGGRAVGLRLAAPARIRPQDYDTAALKLAGFPPQPDRFVGRTQIMTHTSAALAAMSGVPGVLLYGMPGGGKSACALELAYTHEDAFDRLVWFKAPDEGQDIGAALTGLALTMEHELPGFTMVHVLADEDKLDAFLPRLTEMAEQRRVLIVIDNIESLLTEGGQWRDTRWGKVMGALSAHAGQGRVVLTSRRVPAASLIGLRAESVDALSLDEALLLTRELPHLRRLIDGELAGVNSDTARRLARGVLNIAQGHPKLLELADGQAAEAEKLARLVEAGDQAWRDNGGVPDGFFTNGQARASGDDYLQVLAAWTQIVSETLTAGQRTLFSFLCCMEESDRISPVVTDNWVNLWHQLALPGDPPGLDDNLSIAGTGLVAVSRRISGGDETYDIHPGVATAGRTFAGQAVQDAVDAELARYWNDLARHARGLEAEESVTKFVVHAELAAAPYLMRRGEWSEAAHGIERAFTRDPSRETAATAMPALQEIVAEGQEPRATFMLARVLLLIDPAAAEAQIRAYLEDAMARADFASASVAAGFMINRCCASGHLAEALSFAERKSDCSRRAGLGPWTQLSDQVERLQVLTAMGQAEHVLAEVRRLLEHMQSLPTVRGVSETTEPWAVRETLLDTGRSAAADLGRWDEDLELNAAALASKRKRGAPGTDIAQTRFNGYGSLMELGRMDEALTLLIECRQVFESAHDIEGLGKVLGALAQLENERGNGDASIKLERDAMRYSYLNADVLDIAISHHNLGNYISRHLHQRTAALPHHLAAALIFSLADAGASEFSKAALGVVHDLRTFRTSDPLPATVQKLCRSVAEVPGVDLERLLDSLTPDPPTLQDAFERLLTRLRARARARYLASWDPAIAGLLAADAGDTKAAAALDDDLARCEGSDSWDWLVTAFRRLRLGEADPAAPDELPEIEAAIVARARDARAGKIAIPVDLWPFLPMSGLLGDVVAGAAGEQDAAGRARQYLESPNAKPALAGVLTRILDGERDPALAAELADPTYQAIVATVLHHLGVHEPPRLQPLP